MFTKELDQDTDSATDQEIIEMYPELSEYVIREKIECHINDSKSGGEWRACEVVMTVPIKDHPKYKTCVTVRVALWKYDYHMRTDVCRPSTMAYFTDSDRILLRRPRSKKENGVLPF